MALVPWYYKKKKKGKLLSSLYKLLPTQPYLSLVLAPE